MADASTAPPAHRPGCLAIAANVLWVIIAGWGLALSYLVSAVIMFVLIITIPFGIQCVKLAGYSFWPFGRRVVEDPAGPPGVSVVGNVLWFVLCGWWLALAHVLAGIALCVTIIGIPFGIQCFKLARLAWWPFGRIVVAR